MKMPDMAAAAEAADETVDISLDIVRQRIDSIDRAVKELLLQRLECSRLAAESKLASGDHSVYRPDREAKMVERLSDGVPEELKKHYISSIKAIITESRAYQYDLMYGRKKEAVSAKKQAAMAEEAGCRGNGIVRIHMSVPSGAEAVPQIISAIYGCGFKLQELRFESMMSTDESGIRAVHGGEAVAGGGCRESKSMCTEYVDFTIIGKDDPSSLGRLIFRLSDETGEVNLHAR